MMKLVECIPNFSVSRERDEAAFNALVETAQAVAGCTVLDVQSDGTHNRCVFTLVGSPEGIGEAAFRLAKRAMEVIDMTKHQGAHPRMGATDVIPFVPTMDMTVEECVELSRQVAQRIWEELRIPSFLYEESATAPERVNLAKIRKGQFEGMPEKLLEPEWAPDFGERKIHPTAGIIAIGARMPLVAFNVNLDTDGYGSNAFILRPLIGIITKIDSPYANVPMVRQWMLNAGCERIFLVNNVTGEGIDELRAFLNEDVPDRKSVV